MLLLPTDEAVDVPTSSSGRVVPRVVFREGSTGATTVAVTVSARRVADCVTDTGNEEVPLEVDFRVVLAAARVTACSPLAMLVVAPVWGATVGSEVPLEVGFLVAPDGTTYPAALPDGCAGRWG